MTFLLFNLLISPVITIFLAPIALATSKVTRPMGPAPKTKTFDPIPTFARLQAWTPTDKGSKSAPSSRLTWSGNLKSYSSNFLLFYANVYIKKYKFHFSGKIN